MRMVSGAGPIGPTGVEDWPSGRAVAALFELGEPVGPLTPVPGAWSNRVFRLRTETGIFAVKEMCNPWGHPRWEDGLAAAWELELVALEAGIAMPEPVANPDDGGPLGWVPRLGGEGEAAVRAHRWVAGRPAPPPPVSLALAAWAGTVLARLHALAVPVADPELYPPPRPMEAGQWSRLRAAAIGSRAPWAVHLAAVEPLLARIGALVLSGRRRPDREVMTHGDLDPKNLVIAGRGGPHLCDWDVARPWEPRRELADVALGLGAWSEVEVSRAVLTAYARAGGPVPRFEPADLGFTLTKSLDWLVFNIERSVGLRPARPEESDRAGQLVPRLVDRLVGAVAVAEQVDGWLRI
jgi:Ser/Thr protein kinase RdoA (MazF antagonist)